VESFNGILKDIIIWWEELWCLKNYFLLFRSEQIQN
jgi:hypothetical protein